MLASLAAYALLSKSLQQLPSISKNRLVARAADPVCDDVHLAEDQCAFVRRYCVDDEPGLVSYLGFYYCSLPNARPVAFALLALWLGLLFSTIGIAASDFFSVNLSTIASVLRMPESLAGVTFLALGNGSPDVFSTFAAMGSNSGSMAVGELIGAAGFIVAVVAGSMALVREFKVSKKTFVRDIIFFILAVTFTMVFLLDGKIHLWECSLMIGFYVFYVLFVVAWHWYSARRKRRRTKQAASRSHFSVVTSPAHDDIEPYHDEREEDGEEDGAVGHGRVLGTLPDLGALEAGPSIHVEDASREGGDHDDDDDDDDDDEENKRHVASEMANSMRVNRPRWRRTHSTVAPIRPSLMGALEFRSVLSSLAKSRNMRLAPLQRGYSDHSSAGLLSWADEGPDEPYSDYPTTAAQAALRSASRNRALSSGDVPRHLSQGNLPNAALLLQPSQEITDQRPDGAIAHIPDLDPSTTRQAKSPRPRAASTKGGHLAPPPDPLLSGLSPELVAEPRERFVPSLSLRIPSPNLQPSQVSSPSLSPFPGYYESPVAVSPGQPTSRQPYLQLPSAAMQEYDHIPGLDPASAPKPIKWWPYKILPPPHALWRTFAPTLQGWKEKNIWDKMFSVLSVPSVFFLVITLPVVETEPPEDEDAEDASGLHPHLGVSGLQLPNTAIASESQAALVPETEWQEYRRRSNSYRSRSSSASRPGLGASNTPGEVVNSERFPFPEQHGHNPGPYTQQPLSITGPTSEPVTEQEEVNSWKRWLVVVQIFTGPLFTVFIVWSKYMDQPARVLVTMILWSLVGSLIVLALLLLTTSPATKPKYHFLFCFFGFVIAVAWISTIAEEVVGVLKAVGVILGMSEAILGLTVFAVGNSVGDLVADITVARLGYPVMALSACFGGPMLNILLGIGLGGTYMTIKSAKHKHKAHPNRPMHYGSYHLDLPGTLFISAMTVLVTLLVLLILVPSNNWIMSRKIGLTLIALWVVGTIANVIVEITGVWEAVS
ncbi:Sodium/calcium exchanger protein-domain-containing protein [Coniella lustricola]|uniref:Sodium/calcium exchanger protein-domain-containing protein n=1 Tax=Coniella lustricola TaxID=2025994 RepID=A0A2T3A2J6_9PEZI|nr:Sodium/calcium exchanger protein-domain-containing protein [Coniella lustricola]